MGREPRVEVRQRLGAPRRLLGASGEHRDGSAIDRARRESAANGELQAGWAVLAREHQNVDHLPRGLRRAVALRDRAPERIKAAGPRPAVALLGQRERAGQSPGLAREQLEVVVKDRAGGVAAVQAFVARDDAIVVSDDDLPRGP